jgi:uncharacterized cupin superfamily protein
MATASKPLSMYPPPGGTGDAILSFAPNPSGEEGYMHRTQTLDYCFLISGEMELALDGGGKRVVNAGDAVVRRAAMHA